MQPVLTLHRAVKVLRMDSSSLITEPNARYYLACWKPSRGSLSFFPPLGMQSKQNIGLCNVGNFAATMMTSATKCLKLEAHDLS